MRSVTQEVKVLALTSAWSGQVSREQRAAATVRINMPEKVQEAHEVKEPWERSAHAVMSVCSQAVVRASDECRHHIL